MFSKKTLTLLLMSCAPLCAGESTKLDLMQVFKASPMIYTILLMLSLFSFCIWLYSVFTLRIKNLIPETFVEEIRGLLQNKHFDAALLSCKENDHFISSILASALSSRQHGHQVMVDAMQTEGKRCGVSLWQRISLLNDVVIIAPMFGLLGTVMGLFYAFYDVNRSADTLASIFDGLGIAVGTTVAGLSVAILAMIFYASLKFRVISLLNTLENETLTIGNLIEAV